MQSGYNTCSESRMEILTIRKKQFISGHSIRYSGEIPSLSNKVPLGNKIHSSFSERNIFNRLREERPKPTKTQS